MYNGLARRLAKEGSRHPLGASSSSKRGEARFWALGQQDNRPPLRLRPIGGGRVRRHQIEKEKKEQTREGVRFRQRGMQA
jgi:hypothetical protein